ncbi:MAG: FHA domain-containing protein [Actinomycetota bacterium]
MPEIVLQILKYFFILLIFLFLARAVKAMYMELYGSRAPAVPVPAPQAAAPARAVGKAPDRLVVSPPDGKPRSYDIPDELIIGRGEKCHVVITDPYSSQVHARVYRRGDQMFIEDMGSTNGTYLNRRKVGSPLPVARGDTARIGKTEMEFKR